MNELESPSPDFAFPPVRSPFGGFDFQGSIALEDTSEDFDRVDFEDDAPDLKNYRLTIAGLVSRTHQFTLQDLQDNFVACDVTALLSAEEKTVNDRSAISSNPIQKIAWRGCQLADVLEYTGVSSQAKYVEFIWLDRRTGKPGTDPFGGSMPVAKAFNRNVLLAWSADGKSLDQEEGGPLRVIVPGCVGVRSLKWLDRINVLVTSCSSRSHVPVDWIFRQ